MADESSVDPRLLFLGDDRFFLVPPDADLPAGSFEVVDQQGHTRALDPEALAAYEVPEEEARTYIQSAFAQAAEQVGSVLDAFMQVFRQTASDDTGPVPGMEGGGRAIQGMLESAVGAMGDPERMHRLQEQVEQVAAKMEREGKQEVADALRSFPDRLRASIAAQREGPTGEH